MTESADAWQEIATGIPVGGKMHSQKAEESIRRLQRWLIANPNAAGSDRHAAEQVMLDLKEALGRRI